MKKKGENKNGHDETKPKSLAHPHVPHGKK